MSKNNNTKTKKRNTQLLPIILMMGFVPLIVHMFSYNANLSQFDWFPAESDSQIDFFFGWKMVAIIVIGVIMAIILVGQYLKDNESLKFENSFYFLMVYALFVLMSALFSSHKYWVAHGTYELFEPVWVVFTYIIVCYYVYEYVEEEHQVEAILRWAGIGIAGVTLIGTFQYFGLDYFRSFVGKHLMTSTSWWDKLDQLTFNFADKTSYTTLYNPNFLSFYFGMLIPLLICLFIGTKKIWHRAAIAVAEVLCIICLIGSRSTTGWMALVVGGVILALVLLSRNKKLFGIGIAVAAVGIIAAIILGNTTSAGQGIKNTILGTYHMKDQFAVNAVDTNDDAVVFDIFGNKVSITYDQEDETHMSISCKDADGNELSRTMTDETQQIYVLDDSRFDGMQIQPAMFSDTIAGIIVTVDGIQWNFTKMDDGTYAYINSAGKIVKCHPVRQVHLFREDAMSMRGHIWNNTIPLLGRHVLMGSGANTYMMEYPQDDYIGHAYIYGQNNFDVKAHCWYLQQWVETGLFGTLALLGFLIWYLIRCVRIYRRVDLHERLSWIGFGLFAAVLVYMVAAVVNDSNVCTAPVFWCILGLGLAVNRMLVRNGELFEIPKEITESVRRETPVPTEKHNTVSVQPEMETKQQTAQMPPKASQKKQSRKQRRNQK